MEIKVLGSVSPYCKGEHNCPGFLIDNKGYNVLLDCGNGITRNLSFPDDLRDLSVLISHLHKDHYGDLGALQYASYVYFRNKAISDKVDIYLPPDFGNVRESIISEKDAFCDYHIIDESLVYDIGGFKATFYDNKSHSIPSYVIKLEGEGLKVVYTSDVGNTNLEELIKFAYKANLLICESTLIRRHNLNLNTHLHAYEAGLIAKAAQASSLMLTHFWPEDDPNEYLDEARKIFDRTIIAEEGKVLALSKR